VLIVSDKLREQVRQLLALADDPGASASERAGAMQRAGALMSLRAIHSPHAWDTSRVPHISSAPSPHLGHE